MRRAARVCWVFRLSPILETLCLGLAVPPGLQDHQNGGIINIFRNAAITHSSTSLLKGRPCAQCRFKTNICLYSASAYQIWEGQRPKINCKQYQVNHSVRATLRDWWEDLFQRVPGEQSSALKVDFGPWLIVVTILCILKHGRWQAHADGVGVACRGECPCPSEGFFCPIFFCPSEGAFHLFSEHHD